MKKILIKTNSDEKNTNEENFDEENWKIFFINFFLYIKMVNKYYQKHKEKLQKESRERYQNLSEEEKEKNSIIMNVVRIFMKNKTKRNWVNEKLLLST